MLQDFGKLFINLFWLNMEVLGIIPARGGSKRLVGKNLRTLNKRPLIVYTIDAARKSKKINRLIVSTESPEIKKVSETAGAEVPFIRPQELAGDNVPDKPVLLHALNQLKSDENYLPDIVVLLRPTTPFKTPEVIDSVIDSLVDKKIDSVRTVTKVEGVYHPYWMYKKDFQNLAVPFIEGIDVAKYYQSQLLPPVFRLNGVVDAIKSEVILKKTRLYGSKMQILEIPEELSFDIDTELDLKICEMLIKTSHQK